MLKKHKEYRTAYVMIAPLILVMLLFVMIPFVNSVVQSFKSINLTMPGQDHWIGFKNYTDIFQDQNILNALLNTFYYTVIAIVFEILLGLLIALMLRSAFRFRFLVLAVLIIPWSLPPLVGGITWAWIFNPQYGILNVVLYRMGMIHEYQLWTLHKDVTIGIISLVHVWKNMPFAAVVLLSFLQQIPKDLYESSSIDGASRWQSFRYITLPMLAPALAIALTMSTIAAINIFDEVFSINAFGLETRSIMIENYSIAFKDLRLGYGMAVSMVITLISLLFSWSYIRSTYRKEAV
jgi:multiple sugar transport system permease protein